MHVHGVLRVICIPELSVLDIKNKLSALHLHHRQQPGLSFNFALWHSHNSNRTFLTAVRSAGMDRHGAFG
jgi:hypothetical protein